MRFNRSILRSIAFSIVIPLVLTLLTSISMPAQAVAPLTCATGGTCVIGDTGPGGGKVFYVAPTTFTQQTATGSMCTTNCKYLEAAPRGWNDAGVPADDPIRTWVSDQVQEPGQTNQNMGVPGTRGEIDQTIGYGYKNSELIKNQIGNGLLTSAAVLARAYTSTISSVTYSDWYLPSKDELNKLNVNQASVGAMNPTSYWSSSGANFDTSWSQSFSNNADNGVQSFNSTNSGSLTVRPIRAIRFGTTDLINCGTSGTFTIVSNEVTGHTNCIGSVVIPEGVTGIGSNSFIYAGVTSMTIPASVTTITSHPFNCTAGTLLSITVHADNLNFSSTDGVLFDKSKTEILVYPASKAGASYAIPSTVLTLRSCSFSVNKFLTSIALPNTLVTMGGVAFLSAESLQTVTVGTGLNSWGEQSFSGAQSLTSFTIDPSNASFTSTDGIAYNKNETTLVAYPLGNTATSYTAPITVVANRQATFADAANIRNVDFSTIATLDAQAFMDSAVKEVTLGNSLTAIPVQTFQNAMVLERVTFGTGLTSIDPNGFFNNFKLNCIIYPGSNATIQNFTYPNSVVPVANSTLCPKAPAFTLSASSGTVVAGTAITSYTIDASAGGAVTSYAISPAISNGTLSFSTSTGLLSGTPDTAAGATSYTITANNAISPDATRTFSLTIRSLAPPSITLSTSTVTATAGTAITSYTIDSSAGGTVASYVISPAISNGSLTFSTATGLISGTPSAAAGATTYRITARNSSSQFARDFSLTINAAPVPVPTPTPTPVVVVGPPPSILKTITAPKISSNATHIFCLAGSFIFIRNGWTEETPKITSQRYLLIQDGKIVDIIESTKSQAIFEKKSSYLNTTLSCMILVGQENLTSTASSMSPNLMLVAKESKRVELKRLDAKYYADGDAAYLKKSEEFAHIAEVKQAEISVAKTSAAILLASAKYQKAFAAASDLWKLELKKATTDRELGQLVAEDTYLDSLEKSGISIFLRAAAPIVAPTPTPKPTPTPSPIGTTNPQPTTQMSIAGIVYFETALYELSPVEKKKLRALARKINVSGAQTILAYGHTDNRGGVNNTVLSQNRAKAVANYLRPLLTSKKISIGWYASKKPVSGGTSAAALALNRRVEIYTK